MDEALVFIFVSLNPI